LVMNVFKLHQPNTSVCFADQLDCSNPVRCELWTFLPCYHSRHGGIVILKAGTFLWHSAVSDKQLSTVCSWKVWHGTGMRQVTDHSTL
jgi:hypothetical protein